MKDILMNGYAEWPFLHQKGEEMIEGKIDLWAKIDDTIWVIDYKTGRKLSDKRVVKQLQLLFSGISRKIQTEKETCCYLPFRERRYDL